NNLCLTALFIDFERKEFKHFFILYHLRLPQKEKKRMTTQSNEKQASIQPVLVSFISMFQKIYCFYHIYFICDLWLNQLEEDIQVIIWNWIRILNIKLGWVNDLDKLVSNYVMFYFHSITN
ncbi:hypothetical protein RFI_39619, partial [Reticulomyxa filosa]